MHVVTCCEGQPTTRFAGTGNFSTQPYEWTVSGSTSMILDDPGIKLISRNCQCSMSLTRNIDSAHYQKRGLEDFGYLQVA